MLGEVTYLVWYFCKLRFLMSSKGRVKYRFGCVVVGFGRRFVGSLDLIM